MKRNVATNRAICVGLLALFLVLAQEAQAQDKQAKQARKAEQANKAQAPGELTTVQGMAQYEALIARQAATLRLDQSVSSNRYFYGQLLSVTPAIVQGEALADGKIIGVLETELSGERSNLPPGRYNLFLVKAGGAWHCYAERRGQIVAEAARVAVSTSPPGAASRRPEIGLDAVDYFLKIDTALPCGATDCIVTTGWDLKQNRKW